MFGDIAFFCLIMIISILISKVLYKIDLGPFKRILHILDFFGVIVHEASHAIASLLVGVPVKEIRFAWKSEESDDVSPHGHVRIDTRKDNFLKDVVISFAPLIISTYLFIFCLDLAFNVAIPDLGRVFFGFTCISLILGASPSSTDLAGIGTAFTNDIQYSLYQLFLVVLSIISIIFLVALFKLVIFELFYAFLIAIGYLAYKYVFLGVSKLTRDRHLRLNPKFSMSTYTRKTRRPLKPVQLGFEEAQW